MWQPLASRASTAARYSTAEPGRAKARSRRTAADKSRHVLGVLGNAGSLGVTALEVGMRQRHRAGERHRSARARSTGEPERAARPVPARLSRVLRRLGRGAAGFCRAVSCGGARPARLCPLLQAARASRPTAIKHLVRDILALGEQLSPDRPFALVAHDWGASVAYATAIAAPARIAKLVVINGVHPGPFQRALMEDEAQRKASAYIHFLREPEGRGAPLGQQLREAARHAHPLRPAALADAAEAGAATSRPGRRRAR